MCLNPEDIIGGHYRIVRQLGSGGSARTYLANDLNLPDQPRRVVKEIKPWSDEPSILQDAEERFNREANALYSFDQCDRIPKLFGCFPENGKFYIIQEYIAGHPLSQELTGDRQWSEAEVIKLLKDILEVLKIVHEQDKIHRDIKPSNLIRCQDGKISLIDFGIVKEIGNSTASAPGQGKRTKAYGTEGYMPIEQARGYPKLCSDIYAVGIIAIQALTGLNPPLQTDKNGEILGRIWASQVSSRLAKILDKMMHQDYRQRYQSAADVLEELNNLQALAGQKQRRIQKDSSINKLNVKLNKRIKIFGLIVLIVAIVLSLYLYSSLSFDPYESNNYSVNPNNTPTQPHSNSQNPRISFGDKILIQTEVQYQTPEFKANKEKGIYAINAHNYSQAYKYFNDAITKSINAPETRIYLNNTRIAKEKKNAYTIAVAVPIGRDPDAALEVLRGVAQAQKEINEKDGINGRLLKVLIANDDDDPEIANQIASELVNRNEVLGVVGHSSSDVTSAVGKRYEKGNLVTISPTSTSVKLSDSSPYFFRTVPNDEIAAKALTKYIWENLNLQKAAVYYTSTSGYSKSLKFQFIKEASVDRELEFDLSSTNFNASKSVAKAIERNAQVLMLVPNNDTLKQALQVIQQADKKQLKLLGGDDVYDSQTLEEGREAAVGMVLAVAWHPNADPKSQNFLDQAYKLWHTKKVNWRTAMSYDATQALIQAIKRNPKRSGVQQALSASDFSATGASDTVKFWSSGDRIGTIQLVEVCRNKNTETGYDFVPVVLNCKV